jgi:hypothetical protein
MDITFYTVNAETMKYLSTAGTVPIMFLKYIMKTIPILCFAGLSGTRAPCKDTGLFPLVETEPCPCARYTLQPTGPWSDCILEGEGVSTSVAANGRVALGVCGAGSRFRRVECLDADGNLVEPRCLSVWIAIWVIKWTNGWMAGWIVACRYIAYEFSKICVTGCFIRV